MQLFRQLRYVESIMDARYVIEPVEYPRIASRIRFVEIPVGGFSHVF